jgi:hypothetical protein
VCDYCACRAVLPVSWAFSVTGVVCGIVIMVLVAAANAYTSDMLLRQAHHTGSTDYESLALVTGGRWWKVLWFRTSEFSSPLSFLLSSSSSSSSSSQCTSDCFPSSSLLSSSSSLQPSSLLAKNCEEDVEEKHESGT